MPWMPLDEHDEFPTLGYLVADWMEAYLLQPETDEPQPFIPTQEQLEFLVNMYRIDPETRKRRVARAVLSRPRGSGKSPFGGALAAVEALGPVVCDGWDSDGQPVGVSWATRVTPKVEICATTDDQTSNVWEPLLEMLRGSAAEAEYRLDVMDSFIALPRGVIRTRTSSASSVKGSPTVFAVMDQTETWFSSNGGHRLARTLRNNAEKRGGAVLELPNAYVVGDDSVAERTAKYADDIANKRVKTAGAQRLYYDHREAPVTTDIADRDSLIAGLRFAYGDASGHRDGCVIHEPPCTPGWVDIERIAGAFWETDSDPAEMCADFLNQITAASDAWVTQPELRAIADYEKTISSNEPITLGFDGSEGRQKGIADSTVLMGYSVTQRHLFKIGVWAQPDGPLGEGWQPPKLEIEQKVREVFDKYNVVGFYADPSAGWAGEVKAWEALYHRRLKAKVSANEPIRYNQRAVSQTCEAFAQLLSAIRQKQVTYDGSPDVTAHFLNARKDKRRTGYVLVKPLNDQDYSKIDCTWGAMFAYRAGLDAVGKGQAKPRQRRMPRRLY